MYVLHSKVLLKYKLCSLCANVNKYFEKKGEKTFSTRPIFYKLICLQEIYSGWHISLECLLRFRKGINSKISDFCIKFKCFV